MEKLRLYLNGLPVGSQHEFAGRCKTTLGYLRKAISIRQKLDTGLCADIERESSGAVRRWDLRHDDWRRIWPELLEHPDAPPVPAEAGAA